MAYSTKKPTAGLNRRDLLKTSLLLAGGVLLPAAGAAAPPTNAPAAATPKDRVGTRRKLGTLEVSSIGLGVQNMSRTYQTTVPTRTEMHRIARTAYDHRVTLFDAAEAYGPFEVERILGEAGSSILDGKLVVETAESAY